METSILVCINRLTAVTFEKPVKFSEIADFEYRWRYRPDFFGKMILSVDYITSQNFIIFGEFFEYVDSHRGMATYEVPFDTVK